MMYCKVAQRKNLVWTDTTHTFESTQLATDYVQHLKIALCSILELGYINTYTLHNNTVSMH